MEKIAIVGTGIAAMGAAYYLKDAYDITFYEKNDYPGGHSNTVGVDEDGSNVYMDTGFMVFNHRTYPNLIRLFKELDIETMPTSMSFSVQHLPSGLEYCGTGINGLFAQRKNIVSLRYWKMLMEMDRFNKQAIKILDDDRYLDYSLKDYVEEEGYSEDFIYKFLIPISSAVWSSPPDEMLRFSAVTLVQFFKNHGFLGLRTHFQWYTPKGGSRHYRDKILSFFPWKVLLNNPVTKVMHENGRAAVYDVKGQKYMYDKVIIAAHADEALKILGDPTDDEKRLLSNFSYQKNKATLHTDASIMPKTKLAWSSWNYRIDRKEDGRVATTTIYSMNSLQNVSQKKNYFVSINEMGEVDPKKILWEYMYEHPLYNVPAIAAQKELYKLNENGTRYFCGAYFKYGFHEDGLTSGINVMKAIKGIKERK